MELSDKEIEKRIAAGAIHALVTFEIVGKPQKHIEKTLDEYIENLEKAESVTVLDIDRAAAEELEEEKGFFGVFAEAEILAAGLTTLTSISLNMMPASIEILAPNTFTFDATQLQEWQNDILSQLHTIGQELRGERQKSSFHVKNITRLLQNTITLLLTSESMNTETLSRMTGVEEQHLQNLLEHMKKEKLVTLDGELWTLNSSKK